MKRLLFWRLAAKRRGVGSHLTPPQQPAQVLHADQDFVSVWMGVRWVRRCGEKASRNDIGSSPGTGGTAEAYVGLMDDEEEYSLGGVYVWFELGSWNQSRTIWTGGWCTDWYHVSWGGGSCFAKGTPIVTNQGSKPIEQIRPGDVVMTSPVDDPKAKPVMCRVEENSESRGRLLEIEVAGRVVKATPEHPFYVRGKAWTSAKSLVAGDQLRSHDGQWVEVVSVSATGSRDESLYNLRLDKHSAYFVGDRGWGFSILCSATITFPLPVASKQNVTEFCSSLEG